MADEVDASIPPWLHLLSAFLAMEPVSTLISLARKCGGGYITKEVQNFIWDHCINPPNEAGNHYSPYSKNLLKKLIHEVETEGNEVLDEIYEQYACYMSSLKDSNLVKGEFRVHKCISFLFPNESSKLTSCPSSMKLKVQLQCSLNMLEGDTGCSLWPSSLLLCEFILSRPDIFSDRSCFEVGSGVGLVGICLAHVKASQVILSDGDLSTLRNMMMNLELNHLSSNTSPEGNSQNLSTINCIHLPWESAAENGIQNFKPDIILGADVIYDPSCLPHLVDVLSTLIHRRGCCSYDGVYTDTTAHDDGSSGDTSQIGVPSNGCPPAKYVPLSSKEAPVAYIASVIRNIDTFNYFISLAEQANLDVLNVTERYELFDLLPYMYLYDRPTVQLFTVTQSARSVK